MSIRYRFTYHCDSEADLTSCLSVSTHGELAHCIAEDTYWIRDVSSFISFKPAYQFVPFYSGTLTLTNMPLADTELPGTQYRLKIDLSGYKQFRVTCRVATAGVAGADIRFQCSDDDSSFMNLDGVNGPEIDISSTGEKDTGWVDIDNDCRANDVRIRMMGKSGNGAADPVVRQIVLHFK